MPWLRLAWRLPRLIAVVLGGLVLAASVAVPCWLGVDIRLVWRQRLSRAFMRQLSAALPFDIHISGQAPDRPMLWVANHVSWTDIPLLGALQPLSFLSKSEVRQWPLAGWLAAQAGTLFIRRGAGDTGLLNSRLAERLGRSEPMLIFPEGTSTDGSRLATFHGRLLGCADMAGVDIQPVAIRYQRDGARDPLAPFTGDQGLPEHLLGLLRSTRSQVLIQLLPPLPSHAQPRGVLARQAQQAIAQALFDGEQPLPGLTQAAPEARPPAARNGVTGPGEPARP